MTAENDGHWTPTKQRKTTARLRAACSWAVAPARPVAFQRPGSTRNALRSSCALPQNKLVVRTPAASQLRLNDTTCWPKKGRAAHSAETRGLFQCGEEQTVMCKREWTLVSLHTGNAQCERTRTRQLSASRLFTEKSNINNMKQGREPNTVYCGPTRAHALTPRQI